MDIEKLRDNYNKRHRNELMKQDIRSKIKEFLDDRESRRFETRELFKPVVTAQKEVKQTIDEKQNKLIEKLKDNQEELIGAVDTLSNIMSTQGSQNESLSGVNKWLRDLPEEYEPLEMITEKDEDQDEEKDDDEDDDEDEEKESVFTNSEKDILRKYEFDPDLKEMPTKEDIKSKISHLNGKRRNKNTIISAVAKKEQDALSKYLNYMKGFKKGKNQTGKGIRTYRQPKRQAYKINNGQYGGLLINVPRLINEMVVEAVKDGEKVYEDMADKSLVDLLTKRFDPKKRYSSRAIQIFNNLNMLSNIPKHRSSRKSKLIGGAILYSEPKDLMKRLTLLTGSRKAGNTSFALRNEIWQIINHLLKQGIIIKPQYEKFIKAHLM